MHFPFNLENNKELFMLIKEVKYVFSYFAGGNAICVNNLKNILSIIK